MYNEDIPLRQKCFLGPKRPWGC